MDFKMLDKIVTNYANDNENNFAIKNSSEVMPMCEKVINEPFVPVIEDKWSRTFNLNESINYIYNFLKSIDEELTVRFMNIIRTVDENNQPYVNFIPRQDNLTSDSRLENGKVYIYYDNSPKDMLLILHEVLHKLNECPVIDEENNSYTSFTREYLGETVSITGEMFLSNYLYEQGIITGNDLTILKNWRLNADKEHARNVIVDNELLRLKLSGEAITKENIYKLINSYDKGSPYYPILLDELHDLRRTTSILKNGELNLRKSQKYVIGQVLAENLSQQNNITDFIELHNEVGNPDSDIVEVVRNIREKHRTL